MLGANGVSLGGADDATFSIGDSGERHPVGESGTFTWLLKPGIYDVQVQAKGMYRLK